MEKQQPKKYHIDSFEKLCNAVNEENAERLAVDLAGWIIGYAKFVSEIRKKHPKECKRKRNSSIVKASFIWTDDGKNEVTGIIITNEATGEITEKNF